MMTMNINDGTMEMDDNGNLKVSENIADEFKEKAILPDNKKEFTPKDMTIIKG